MKKWYELEVTRKNKVIVVLHHEDLNPLQVKAAALDKKTYQWRITKIELVEDSNAETVDA